MDSGESLGIAGESGAGKTTLAELAAGLIDPSSGTVMIKGRTRDRINRKQRRQIARQVQLIWQDAMASLDPRMTVAGIISEPLKIHGVAYGSDQRKQIENILAEVGLPGRIAHSFPHQLSGGEAQRVVIARALTIDPALLICDEPASSLDARVKAQITTLLNKLRRERNLSLLIIAHDLRLLRSMTDNILVIRRGEIVERGRTKEVLSSPAHPYTKLLVDSELSLARVGSEKNPNQAPAVSL